MPLPRVPSAPIRRIMQEWMAQVEREHPYTKCNLPKGQKRKQKVEVLSPMSRMSHAIYGPTAGKPEADKLRNILRNSDTVDFDMADLILCRLECHDMWIRDPELYKAYLLADLPALDAARPTVEEAA